MPRPILLAALTAFLVMMGLGVLFPVLPFFTRELGLSDLEMGLLLSSYPAAGVLVSPLWGRFSERRGRRPAIAIGLLGFGASFLLFGFGHRFAELLAARLLGGLLSAAAIPAIFAYAADVTDPARRSAAMGVLGAAMALGASLGPAIGGLLTELGRWMPSAFGGLLAQHALRIPYLFSAALGFATAAAVLRWLPESVSGAGQPESHGERAARGDAAPGPLRLARSLWPFLVYAFLVNTARLGVDTTIGFLIADRFGGTAGQVGLLLFSMGMLAVLVQGALVRVLARRLGDAVLVVAGTALMTVGLALIPPAAGWSALAAAGLCMAAGFSLLSPAFLGMLSRSAEGSQGEVQGLHNSAQQLGRVVGPALFTGLYQEVGPSAPYLAAAGLCALGLALALARLLGAEPREPT